MSVRPRAMRDAFLEEVWSKMSEDDRIFFVSADFGSPVLDRIRADHADRFVNVGIAEQNLINISAGLATEGYKVFAYAIAPFITMRCYEQIRVSLALLSKIRPMNVSLIGVGAGYSYVVSGPTHQCYEDITLMRALPGVQLLSPSDHVVSAALADTCLDKTGIKYLRLDAQVLPVVYKNGFSDLGDGFHIHAIGEKLCLLGTGYMLHTAMNVAEKLGVQGLRAGVIDLIDLTKFSRQKLRNALQSYSHIVTLEEGFRGRGGVDAILFELVAREELKVRMLNIGVEPDYNFELGGRSELHEKVGIGPDIVVKRILDFVRTFSD